MRESLMFCQLWSKGLDFDVQDDIEVLITGL